MTSILYPEYIILLISSIQNLCNLISGQLFIEAKSSPAYYPKYRAGIANTASELKEHRAIYIMRQVSNFLAKVTQSCLHVLTHRPLSLRLVRY